MAIRLVLTITAAPGKGSELGQAYKTRCLEIMKEPGCDNSRSSKVSVNPDKLALLERWTGPGSLWVHAQLNRLVAAAARARTGGRPEREDYEYNRTR